MALWYQFVIVIDRTQAQMFSSNRWHKFLVVMDITLAQILVVMDDTLAIIFSSNE